MARYYFDVIHKEHCARDHLGLELASMDAMRTEVSRVLLELARDEIEDEDASLQVNVRDDTDYVVFSGKLDYSTRLG